MSSRETILARLRANRPAGDFPLPEVPPFDDALPPALDTFKEKLALMGGKWVEPAPGESIAALIARCFPEAGPIRSATPELPGYAPVAAVAHPRDLADVDIGVVRAAFGVAETGSVFLDEKRLGVNALGYLAQHLVVLLDPARILGNLHHAYADPGFREARYAVLMTGPSATADIEGVLIRGAQGVRSLTVVFTPVL